MSEDQFKYDQLMQEAHRGIIRKVLRMTAQNGLQGDHHFYIVFNTVHPGVRLSERLRNQYPEEMTIILQYQFKNLRVFESHFEVQLSFGNIPEILKIPFAAINGFVDPSVPFGLRLQSDPASGLENSISMLVPGLPTRSGLSEVAEFEEDEEDMLDDEDITSFPLDPFAAAPTDDEMPDEDDPDDDQPGGGDHPSADIVSLDAFRKKSK